MEIKYKTIPFDVNRINEKGVQVVTRNGLSVRILCFDAHSDNYPIVGLIKREDGNELCNSWTVEGYNSHYYRHQEQVSERLFDLFLQVPIKGRRMTNQELSWWVRDCPEEHREMKCNFLKTDALIYHTYEYEEDEANDECSEYVLIRRNGGEWEKPLLIEE